MRRLLPVVVCAAALLAASPVDSAPAAAEARSCLQLSSTFNIQLLGDRAWGWQLGRYAAIPAKTSVLAVWSMGGPRATNGIGVYGWATRARSSFMASCTRVQPAASRVTNALRPARRVQDGWFTGRKYACQTQGRVVVEVRDVAGGKRLTVRTQRGVLLAVGEVTGKAGWIRGSKSCVESER